MEIYDETTGAVLTAADEELGYTYPGKRQVGMEPERIEVIPSSVCKAYPEGLRRRIPAKPLYEDCLYYHTYTREELVERYKAMLSGSDYAIIKIAEAFLAGNREKLDEWNAQYSNVVSQRQMWRQKINELEGS